MNRLAWLVLVFLTTPATAPAQTYWLGRKPDPKTEEYVFDVPVPADLAAALACTSPKYAKFRDGVREYQWDVGGKTQTFVENTVAWKDDLLDEGSFAYLRNGAVDSADWASVSTKGNWKAARDVLVAQKAPLFKGDWSQATPVLLKWTGTGNPKLTVNFDADAPFDVRRHPGEYDTSIGMDAATKKPQIVPVVRGDELYLAWQTWGRTRPTGKVFVSKVGLGDLSKGKLTAVRDVPSGGVLVGFTLDADGADHVLTAKAEQFENRPKGDFATAVHGTWRPDVLVMHAKGKATDLGSAKYADLPPYGVGNAGSGRLAAGGGLLGSVFARRRFSPADNLIHQEADDLLVSSDLADVPHRAANAASHSFDQRLVFDGQDFVALHQCDQFPVTGLLIEKLRTGSPGKGHVVRVSCFSCPTFGNDVFFELGGLAAEKDGYPVLFTATRNTEAVSPANVEARRKDPWDLALVYVARDFDAKPRPKNPFDVVGSGVLAGGFAKPEEFTVDNFSWNPAAGDFSMKESRTITRQVFWLTDYAGEKQGTRRAAAAKLAGLGGGKYVAVWEEHVLTGGRWRYDQTRAMVFTVEGDADDKRVKPGKAAAFKDLRPHRGDDAVSLAVGGAPRAGWVTAGATNRQLLLHTLDADLKYAAYPLQLP